MQSREVEPPSLSLSLSTGDSLTKQFVNECSPGRDYVFTIVSHFTRQNRSILSLSLTRDGFCSLTELSNGIWDAGLGVNILFLLQHLL